METGLSDTECGRRGGEAGWLKGGARAWRRKQTRVVYLTYTLYMLVPFEVATN